MPPAFSVVIPTFNRAPVLVDALESVLAQTFTDWEAIVVDDGSTDGTESIVASRMGQVRYVKQANAGAAAARNRGIAAATGAYVAFLDSDDAWSPRTLETFSRAIGACESPAMIGGYGATWSDRASAGDATADLECHANFLEASRVHSAFRGTPGLAIRRDVLAAAGGFDVTFPTAEDQDLCLRLGTAPGFAQVNAVPLYFQRFDLQHLSQDVPQAIRGVDRLIARERDGGYPGAAAMAPIRRQIICAAARRVASMGARAGLRAEALGIYRHSFDWHVALKRWRFLLGFPVAALLPRVKAS